METTSPVSSSTKSSIQVLSTRAASLRPTCFLRLALFTFHLICKVEDFQNVFIAFKADGTQQGGNGNFFLRSMYAYITLLMSVANSIHDPLKGITLAEYKFAVGMRLCPKNTPGER
jgi:hypothetical protein